MTDIHINSREHRQSVFSQLLRSLRQETLRGLRLIWLTWMLLTVLALYKTLHWLRRQGFQSGQASRLLSHILKVIILRTKLSGLQTAQPLQSESGRSSIPVDLEIEKDLDLEASKSVKVVSMQTSAHRDVRTVVHEKPDKMVGR